MAKVGDPCTGCEKTESDGAVFGWRTDHQKRVRSPKCQECERVQRKGYRATRKRYEPQFAPGDPNAPLKECLTCWVPKPATTEYFFKHDGFKDGLGVQCKTCRKDYREINEDQLKAAIGAWKQAHPYKCQIYGLNYEARKAGAEGTFDEADLRIIFADQEGVCYYCAVRFGEDIRSTVDHKQPLSKNGSNWPSNLCLACKSCNSSKCDKTEAQFWKYLEVVGRMPEIRARREEVAVEV